LMRLGGIRVVVDPTWVFVFVLMVISLGGSYLPTVAPRLDPAVAWLLGLLAAVLLFASVLVHELSHALLAQRAGIQVPRIRLFLFGGVSEMAAEPHEPRAEARIAAAGPLTSLVLALVAGLLAAPFREGTGAHAILEYLSLSNLLLGLFNLLPGLPLDGGRILRAWLWSRHGNLLRATRTAGRAGAFLGYAFLLLGLIAIAREEWLQGIWLGVLGLFLQRAAGASYETALLRDMLSGVRVSSVMTRDVITVPDHLSLEELVNEHLLRRPHQAFPVVSGSALLGIIGIEQVRGVPREDWVRTPVRQVMTPVSRVAPIAPEDECVAVLERMIRDDVSPLPVVQDGRLVGILSRRDLLKLFRVRSSLAPAR
ncbi:MAG TPA: site-2 protease family protein, partial [Candidatus Polarisedimenticolia bacterium]|nr:site-2 protease family protein [Candidatus Polarisedimenticolia bacterium]